MPFVCCADKGTEGCLYQQIWKDVGVSAAGMKAILIEKAERTIEGCRCYELSKKKNGLTREDISKATGLALNGVLSKIIKNLVDSGFVRENPFFGKKKKDTLYQLADYYSSFYFNYIRDNKGRDEHYWSNTLDAPPARKTWAGNMFEQVCKDHISQIKQKIGILGILSTESSWFVKADKKLGTAGTQIDLIIDRRDRVINLCEMKFSLSEYAIDKDYDEKLRKRIETFRKNLKTKKQFR